MFLFTKPSFFIVSLSFISCAGTPPLKEYNLAYSALRYARKYEAKARASEPYRQAFSLYKEARSHFKNRYYGSAWEAFHESREWAEKAEEISRWKKYKEGDNSF